jgi:hypothetical protein
MSWHIYSSEALPNPDFMGQPGYTPDSEYIRYGGIALPVLPKGEWLELPDSFTTIRHQDWRDKQGTEVEISIKRFKGIVANPERGFAERGVILLDHKPSDAERVKLEHLSAELNLAFRKKHVEFYENQRQIALARQGTYPVTPYVDECYELLAMKKPYSVDALQALRDPGARAAQQIADAITQTMKQEREDAAMRLAEELTKPVQPAQTHAQPRTTQPRS